MAATEIRVGHRKESSARNILRAIGPAKKNSEKTGRSNDGTDSMKFFSALGVIAAFYVGFICLSAIIGCEGRPTCASYYISQAFKRPGP